MSEAKPYHCRHIFTDGHQCGSPALRGEQLCFYHHGSRRPATHETIHGLTFVVLPAPDDLHAIQRGLCEVLRLAASNAIDDRHASTLIRGLSICSANLARIGRQQKNAPAVTELVQDFVLDPLLGTLALPPNHIVNPDQPVPDQPPVLTPKPVITYRPPSPEQIAFANACWDKAEAEWVAHDAARALRSPTPTPHHSERSEAIPAAALHPPAPTSCHSERSEGIPAVRLYPLQVQTHPPSNEHFGLQEKNKISNKTQLLHFPNEDSLGGVDLATAFAGIRATTDYGDSSLRSE